MAEISEHEPAGGRKTYAAQNQAASSASPASPSAGAKSVQVQSTGAASEVAGRRAAKAIVTGVRLSYNELTSLKGIVEAMELILGPDARTNLTWLDLSHNKLTQIDEVLLAFPNLTNLYLHSNHINHIQEVKKLSLLEHMQKLTLHGNPLYQARENHGLKNPRSGVIYHLRNCVLKSLDDVVITDTDRRNSLRWAEQNQPKKKRREAKAEDDDEANRR